VSRRRACAGACGWAGADPYDGLEGPIGALVRPLGPLPRFALSQSVLRSPLARVEGQIAINTLVQRLPKLALATDAPEFRMSLTLRGLKSLPVAF